MPGAAEWAATGPGSARAATQGIGLLQELTVDEVQSRTVPAKPAGPSAEPTISPGGVPDPVTGAAPAPAPSAATSMVDKPGVSRPEEAAA